MQPDTGIRPDAVAEPPGVRRFIDQSRAYSIIVRGDLLQPDSQHLPAFPVQSAFVVQWHRTAHLASGKVIGRVEHVASRQTATFDSWDNLLAFMQRVLGGVRKTAHEER